MGVKQSGRFQLSFNTSRRLIYRDNGSPPTVELLVCVNWMGYGELITQHLSDSRRGKNTQLPLADLFCQSVYSRIAGYEDVNDTERLSQDTTFRLIGSEKTNRSAKASNFEQPDIGKNALLEPAFTGRRALSECCQRLRDQNGNFG